MAELESSLEAKSKELEGANAAISKLTIKDMAQAELIEELQSKQAKVEVEDIDALKQKELEETLEIERRLKEMTLALEGDNVEKEQKTRLQIEELTQQKQEEIERVRAELSEANAASTRELKSLQVHFEHLKGGLRPICASGRELKMDVDALRANVLEDMTGLRNFFTSKIGVMQSKMIDIQGQSQIYLQERDVAEQQYNRELTRRRQLTEEVHSLKGNIRVLCRVRPLLFNGVSKNEMAEVEENMRVIPFQEDRVIWHPGDSEKGSRSGAAGGRAAKEFQFNRVFGPQSQQEEVFDEVVGLIDSALDGFKACIFAYGQTGSGKTFTMDGPSGRDHTIMDKDTGVTPRALHRIFENIEKQAQRDWTWGVEMAMLEVYKEQLLDLLSPPGSEQAMEIKQQQAQGGKKGEVNMEISGLTWEEVFQSHRGCVWWILLEVSASHAQAQKVTN
jgi:kinesin family protein C1